MTKASFNLNKKPQRYSFFKTIFNKKNVGKANKESKIFPAKMTYRENFCPKSYAELWIDYRNTASSDSTPFRFTGKELDKETGFYYFGARYLDPKVSRWLSGDPAMGEYVPLAPINDEAKKRNQNLPNGGIFNYINMNVYHYSNNNPVMYFDPDGETSYSFRQKENVYTFFSSGTIIPDFIFGAASFVKGIGILSPLVLEIGGFKEISANGLHALLDKAGITNEVISIITSAPEARILGRVLSAIDTFTAMFSQRSVGTDNVINSLFKDQLTAKSHEGVSILYAYALARLNEMVEAGEIRYSVNFLGEARINSLNVTRRNEIRAELREIRTLLDQNPEW